MKEVMRIESSGSMCSSAIACDSVVGQGCGCQNNAECGDKNGKIETEYIP